MKLIKVLQSMEIARIMTSKCRYKYFQIQDIRYKEFCDKFRELKFKFEEIDVDSDEVVDLVNKVSDLFINYKMFEVQKVYEK